MGLCTSISSSLHWRSRPWWHLFEGPVPSQLWELQKSQSPQWSSPCLLLPPEIAVCHLSFLGERGSLEMSVGGTTGSWQSDNVSHGFFVSAVVSSSGGTGYSGGGGLCMSGSGGSYSRGGYSSSGLCYGGGGSSGFSSTSGRSVSGSSSSMRIVSKTSSSTKSYRS